jgi:hypothetical protein
LTAILDRRDAIAADGSQLFGRASGKIGSNMAPRALSAIGAEMRARPTALAALPVLTPWLRVTIPADVQPPPCPFASRLVYSTTAIISISTIASG